MSTLTQTTTVASLAGKYLTFVLHQESYGIPVLKVREIFRPSTITSVPQMPPYVKGVINLRGRIIPVIDLCAKVGLPRAASAASACIVVVQVSAADQRSVQLGLIVDSVEEVSQFAAADLEPAPEFGATLDTSLILAMAKYRGGIKTLLDLDQILGHAAAAAVRTLLVQP